MFKTRTLRAAAVAALVLSAGSAAGARAVGPTPAPGIDVVRIDSSARSLRGVIAAADSVAAPSAPGARVQRAVRGFEAEGDTYAVVLDVAMKPGTSVSARFTVVRTGDRPEVVLQKSSASALKPPAMPRSHMVPGVHVEQRDYTEVCTDPEPHEVVDEPCEQAKHEATLLAIATCAVASFALGPIGAAVLCTVTAAMVESWVCDLIVVDPPEFCQRYYVEEAEPVVKKVEETTGTSRPHPCETPGGSRNPACDEEH